VADPTQRGVPGIRLLLPTVALVVMLALVWGWSASPARADGDPASDVLATQQLFLPQDAATPRSQQSQLAGLLQEATRRGYPIRVALIASPTDLGSITELWHQPQSYAEFLGQELSLVYRGPLLVVMPDGFGFYNLPRSLAADRSIVAGANPAGGVGAAAIRVVDNLAAAAGHPLPLPAATTSGAGAGGSSVTPWIALAIGALLILMAWTISLRARPLGRFGSGSGSDSVGQSLSSQG
jgi:hypothetical protein